VTSRSPARPVARPGPLILTTGTMVRILSGLQTIVIPVIGDVAEQLGAPLDEVGRILTANLLGAAVSTPIIGRLGDHYGKRPVILAVLAVVAAGSLAAALTTSLGVLIAARVLQSTAYGLFPLAVGVLRDELPDDRLLPALALLSALLSIGGGAGLITTGLLAADGGDYRRIFWLSLAATVLPLVMCRFLLPRRAVPPSGDGVDWWGGLLLGASLVLVLLPLSQGPDWGWLAPVTVGCLAGAVLAGWAFVFVERRLPAPLVSRNCSPTDRSWSRTSPPSSSASQPSRPSSASPSSCSSHGLAGTDSARPSWRPVWSSCFPARSPASCSLR
jgi:MFS family permease